MYPSTEEIAYLQKRFCQLDAITGSSYSQEDTRQGKPHIFTLSVADSTTADERETLAVKAGKLFTEVLSIEPKVSIEHPIEAETDEDGEVVDLVDVEDEYVIKIRWVTDVIKRLPATRLGGEPVSLDGIEGSDIHLPDPV